MYLDTKYKIVQNNFFKHFLNFNDSICFNAYFKYNHDYIILKTFLCYNLK